MKRIGLKNITWSTTEVHDLLSCLSNTHLEVVLIGPGCQLSCSRLPASQTSLIAIPDLDIGASLRIDTLTSLLSRLEVDLLTCKDGCQIQGLSKHQLSKVCHEYCLQKVKQYEHCLDAQAA